LIGTLLRSPWWKSLPARPPGLRGCVALALSLIALALPAPPRARAQGFDQPHDDAPAVAPAAPPAPKLTKPPALSKSVDPVYPPEALADKLAADVTMLIDIDADGHVSGVQVTRPAGHGFDEAAVAAANEMEFSPAEIDGKPGKIRIEYVMHFVPQVVAAPPPEAPPPEAAPPAPAPPEAPPPSAALAPVIVRGRVREKGTRNPIVAADVAVIRNAPGAPAAANPRAEVVGVTDDQGRFEVRGPAPGGLRVIVGDSEHQSCIRDFAANELGGSVVPQMNCYARPRDTHYETHVRAQRQHEEVTRHTLSQGELTTVPGTFGDPLRVIQNLPGVARIPYGIGQLVVRGAAPQDSSVFVDGQRVPILFHFLGGPSVLTPNLIDKIDFYPGGFGVHYGRATAGVLDVTTKNDPVTQVHGNADLNLLDSSAYIEGPLGGGVSGGLAARRSYIDLLLPFVIPQRQGATTVIATPVYWDYQARVGKDLGSAGRVSLSAFGSDDTLHVVSSDPSRATLDLGTRIGFHRLVGSWTASKNGWVSKLSPSYGFDLASFAAGTVAVDNGAQVFGLREDLSKPLSSKLTLVTGFDGQLRLEDLHFHIPVPNLTRTFGRVQPQISTVDRGFTDTGNALYVEALWDPTKDLRVVPGLRGDWFHYNQTDRFTADPRIVAHWSLTPRWAIKGGVGVFHQPQEPQILDSQYGNPHLKTIWADQYHLGFERKLTEVISLDTTFYFLRRHNLPVPERTINFSDAGRGRAYGMELLLRHEITRHFFGWISYTLSRSEQTAASVGNLNPGPMMGGGIPDPMAATTYYPTSFDQTHNLILIASYKLGAWELGSRFRVVTGIPQTPIVGSVFDADYNSYRPVQGPTNSTRRQTFHQLDVRAERTWTYDTWRFSIYLDVQNVYNAQNPELTIYDYRYRQSAPVRGLPFLPILGFRGKF
jgi:TonB family protein